MRGARRTCLALATLLIAAAPLHAQDPAGLLVRGYGMVTGQRFTADQTFDAVFGSAFQPFYGGGVMFVQDNVFLDIAVSHFTKSGDRVFRANGQNFSLGIPLRASVTPLEISAGYRFALKRHRSMVPYVGVGFGKYWYKETSAFADASDNVDTSHLGGLAFGGAEFRLHRLIRASADVEYTHVSGILGQAGFSQSVNEDDLGGVSARVRLIVGR